MPEWTIGKPSVYLETLDPVILKSVQDKFIKSGNKKKVNIFFSASQKYWLPLDSLNIGHMTVNAQPLVSLPELFSYPAIL